MSATLAGNPVAFGVLATRHRRRAYRAAARVLGGAHEAEDVTQDALLHAYLGLATLRDPERFGSWLAAIATNLARMRLRRRDEEPVPPERLEQDGREDPELLEAVRAAIEALPRAEREAVLACDVRGLSAEEAGNALGRAPGAVRVALHRARSRLRRALEDVGPHTTTKEGRQMVEVEVSRVLARVLDDGTPARPPHRAEGGLRVVLLRERAGDRVLPIWIGDAEGDWLALQLASAEAPRPTSADLMARIVEALGGSVERVVVSSLQDSTFFAAISVEGPRGREQLDARPSDAINLARRLGARIYVDESVFAEAALAQEQLEAELDVLEQGALGPVEGEWRDVSPDLVQGWRGMR